MPMIDVSQHVTVPLSDGQYYNVAIGRSDVPQEVADHPFVKAAVAEASAFRKVYVEGADGLMIEADEAGQLVQPQRTESGYGLPGHTVPLPMRTPADASARRRTIRSR